MSTTIQSEITRLTGAKASISTAISGKGVNVPASTKLDGMAALIDAITTGGELESIAITSPPTKTSYSAGEDFDPTGMEVIAVVSGLSIPVSGYTVTPSTLTAGTTEVTLSLTIDGITKTATQVVTVIAYKSFAECTWAEIAQYAADGVASQAFSVGDTRTETIDGRSYELIIYDFDHYSLVTADSSYNNGSGKAAIVIGFKDVFKTIVQYGDDNGSPDWEESNLYYFLNTPFISSKLPSDITAVIRPVYVPSRRITSTTVKNVSCKAFVSSAYEIWGEPSDYGHSDDASEGPQYAYYAAGNAAKKSYLYLTRTSCWFLDSWSSYELIAVTTNSTSESVSKDSNAVKFSPVFCI